MKSRWILFPSKNWTFRFCSDFEKSLISSLKKKKKRICVQYNYQVLPKGADADHLMGGNGLFNYISILKTLNERHHRRFQTATTKVETLGRNQNIVRFYNVFQELTTDYNRGSWEEEQIEAKGSSFNLSEWFFHRVSSNWRFPKTSSYQVSQQSIFPLPRNPPLGREGVFCFNSGSSSLTFFRKIRCFLLHFWFKIFTVLYPFFGGGGVRGRVP